MRNVFMPLVVGFIGSIATYLGSAYADDRCAAVLSAQVKASEFRSHDFYFQHQITSSNFTNVRDKSVSIGAEIYGVPVNIRR
jgi:hypothetical protein